MVSFANKNQLRQRAAVALLSLLLGAGLPAETAAETAAETVKGAVDFPSSHPQRVLFVGNSYFYYNDSLHSHVRRMLLEWQEGQARNYQYKSATISGGRLAQQPIAHFLTPGKLGIEPAIELLIAQGHSTAMLSEAGQAEFMAAARGHLQTAQQRGVDMALYMTPAYVAPHKRADPGATALIAAGYTAAGRALGIPVIPVGLAFDAAYKSRPELALHKDFDGSHPSLAGTYLAAAVVMASIYRAPLDDIGYDYFGALPAQDAAFLRMVASSVVQDYFQREALQ